MGKAKIVCPGEIQSLNVLGTKVRFLCEAETTAGAFSLMEGDLPLGEGPPPHHHAWDEAYYVISGSVDFVIGDQSVRAEAGTFLYAPGGTLHSFKGSSAEPARLLVLDAPAHAAAFFRQVDREVAGPADFPKVPEIGRAHGIHFQKP